MMDNGNGFRNDIKGAEGRSPVFPPGAALGMTWDVDLAKVHGDRLGKLFRYGVDFLPRHVPSILE